MPILGPWRDYRVIWTLTLTVDKTRKELTTKVLSTTSQESQYILFPRYSFIFIGLTDEDRSEAYGSHCVTPVLAVPIASYNSSDDPGGTSTTCNFARPFGTSRDLLSVLKLARRVRRALGESTGSSYGYQALLAELDSFCEVLPRIYDKLTTESQRPSSAWSGEIQCTLNSSRLLLYEVHRQIQRHRTQLRKGGSHSRMQDSWRKIGWSLFKREELGVIQIMMKEAVRRISTVMIRSQWYVYLSTSGIHRDVKLYFYSYDPGRMASEHYLALARIAQRSAELPRVLGYPWEGGPPGTNQATVRLNDMLGQNIYLPIELCTSPEVDP